MPKRKAINSIDGIDKTPEGESQWICGLCQRPFTEAKTLSGHMHDTHVVEGTINLPNQGKLTILREQEDQLFHCYGCPLKSKSKSNFRKHLIDPKNTKCLAIAVLNDSLKSVSPSFGNLPLKIPKKWNSYETSLLEALGESASSDVKKIKTLATADKLGNFPMEISLGGAVLSVTVKSSEYRQLPEQPVIAILNKPKSDPDSCLLSQINDCSTCRQLQPPEIDQLFSTSPFSSIIKTRKYEEISESQCQDLSLNWIRYPNAPQIASCLLAGALLVNPVNGQLVLINEIEVYGRSYLLDCHREKAGRIKGVTKQTSIPRVTDGGVYKGVKVITIKDRDGIKLEIGTNTLNLLVTGCIRLDNTPEEYLSVGGETLVFEINPDDSKNIRIYIDMEQAKLVEEIKSRCVEEITRGWGIEYIRQIRTGFDKIDSYMLCRCSGPLTESFDLRPYTIFTVVDHGNGYAAANGAGKIYFVIGKEVITKGESALLSLKDVLDCVRLAQTSQDLKGPLNAISGLFLDDQTHIPIIGNLSLNQELETLAEMLSSRVSDANKTVMGNLKILFSSKC